MTRLIFALLVIKFLAAFEKLDVVDAVVDSYADEQMDGSGDSVRVKAEPLRQREVDDGEPHAGPTAVVEDGGK